MKNLVIWPNTDAEFPIYRDTGEGGMFAYATWSVPAKDFECVVDVTPTLNVGDVRVHSVGPDAELFEEQTRDLHALNGAGVEDYVAAVNSLDVPADVVVFLGSTSVSAFDEGTGKYFHVTRDELTEEGLSLIGSLEAVYGPATFTTYLDT